MNELLDHEVISFTKMYRIFFFFGGGGSWYELDSPERNLNNYRNITLVYPITLSSVWFGFYLLVYQCVLGEAMKWFPCMSPFVNCFALSCCRCCYCYRFCCCVSDDKACYSNHSYVVIVKQHNYHIHSIWRTVCLGDSKNWGFFTGGFGLKIRLISIEIWSVLKTSIGFLPKHAHTHILLNNGLVFNSKPMLKKLRTLTFWLWK